MTSLDFNSLNIKNKGLKLYYQIKKINADILLLTETSDAINLEPEYHSVKSIPYDRNPDE